jgi:hypothetical protein
MGFRGFANRPVPDELLGLDEEVLQRYADLWRLGQPIPPNLPLVQRHPEEEFASIGDEVCPTCGAGTDDHEEHRVALYDVYAGEVVAGTLFGQCYRLEEALIAIMRLAIALDVAEIPLGLGINGLTDQLRTEISKGRSFEEGLEINDLRQIQLPLDLLAELPEVRVTRADWDGDMPGSSTTYRTFWAADPQAAADALRARIEVVRTWLDDHSRQSGEAGQRCLVAGDPA